MVSIPVIKESGKEIFAGFEYRSWSQNGGAESNSNL